MCSHRSVHFFNSLAIASKSQVAFMVMSSHRSVLGIICRAGEMDMKQESRRSKTWIEAGIEAGRLSTQSLRAWVAGRSSFPSARACSKSRSERISHSLRWRPPAEPMQGTRDQIPYYFRTLQDHAVANTMFNHICPHVHVANSIQSACCDVFSDLMLSSARFLFARPHGA